MTGKPFISGPFPTAVGQELYRKYHFPKVVQILIGLIEHAMSQPCSNQYAEKTIKEQRFKLLFINLSVTVLTVDYYVSECDTYNP